MLLLLYLLLTLQLLCLTNGEDAVRLHPHLLINMGIPCAITADCLSHVKSGGWCRSGMVCHRSQCHRIPNFPCASPVEWCDEREHRCVPRNCTSWRDCDDGVFCNGAERCIAERCLSDGRFDCSAGYCSEELKRCSFPEVLVGTRERFLALKELVVVPQAKPRPVAMRAIPVVGARTSAPTSAPLLGTPTVSPTEAPTTQGGLTNTDIVWIICGVVIIAALGLVLFSIAFSSRHQPQTVIIDDRAGINSPADGMYSTNYRYNKNL
jgi:hypothetical protein